jgi:hypothetical protein
LVECYLGAVLQRECIDGERGAVFGLEVKKSVKDEVVDMESTAVRTRDSDTGCTSLKDDSQIWISFSFCPSLAWDDVQKS